LPKPGAGRRCRSGALADAREAKQTGVSETPCGSRAPGSATAPDSKHPAAAAPATRRESWEASQFTPGGIRPARRIARARARAESMARRTARRRGRYTARRTALREHAAKGAGFAAGGGDGIRRGRGMVMFPVSWASRPARGLLDCPHRLARHFSARSEWKDTRGPDGKADGPRSRPGCEKNAWIPRLSSRETPSPRTA